MAAGVFSTYVTPEGDIMPPVEDWEYNLFGSIISHPCGLGSCPAELDLLAEELRSELCSSAYDYKVTLVLDGGNIDDGTFNQVRQRHPVASAAM